MTLDELIDRVTQVELGLTGGEILSEIIRENEPYIVDMNAQNQLFEQGVNAVGVPIMDYKPYAPLTIQIKREKGQPYDRVTLRDTGDFHGSFYIVTESDHFIITANDPKTAGLVRKYDRRIFGLTPENKNELTWDYIYPDALNMIKSLIYED